MSHEPLQSLQHSLGLDSVRGLIYASLESMELPQRLWSRCCVSKNWDQLAKSCAFAIWLLSLARSCSTCAGNLRT